MTFMNFVDVTFCSNRRTVVRHSASSAACSCAREKKRQICPERNRTTTQTGDEATSVSLWACGRMWRSKNVFFTPKTNLRVSAPENSPRFRVCVWKHLIKTLVACLGWFLYCSCLFCRDLVSFFAQFSAFFGVAMNVNKPSSPLATWV